jgi:hypothetical protein
MMSTKENDMKSLTPNSKRNNAMLKRITASFDRYTLTVRRFVCRYSPQDGTFHYRLSAARKGSGSRGATHLRNVRFWLLHNLTPDQRAIIENLPKSNNP